MAESIRPYLTYLLWMVPLLPLLAGGVIALLPDGKGRLASKLAIAGLGGSLLIALIAMMAALPSGEHGVFRHFSQSEWFVVGDAKFLVGVLLDPISAGMVAMVTFVAMWIFLYSTGYMCEEKRFGRFFGFLSLFCGAMLMVVLANSLLLLFMAWELVGLASYLLIGFYFHKPSAAKAAQKAFITTRVGDMAFFLGMIWLYDKAGTLMFYTEQGTGLLQTGALTTLAGATTVGGLTVSAAASLLLLFGAMGKSGQLPLHTWLPDAMEGPTPVSALIHAATMVAAGVFMIARVHPIFSTGGPTGLPLVATAWIGGATALYAACVAMAQYDIKRILAYSTVSQLGFMMIALGTGGVSAAMFHLIAHAFFKALLFLSAGSVIHGCHDEQDIRKMGGLRKEMPKTFIAYAIGMMALAGFPFLFSGFWSKEGILHCSQHWAGGMGPFLMAVAAALLTAFYMTRQALLVFFGEARKPGVHHPHESPAIMWVPLYVLAAGAMLLSIIATPMWPWYEKWIEGEAVEFQLGAMAKPAAIQLLLISLAIVTVGVSVSWMVYRRVSGDSRALDPMEKRLGKVWGFLHIGMGFDWVYDRFIIAPIGLMAEVVDWIERKLFVSLMAVGQQTVQLMGRLTSSVDESGLNAGFNGICNQMRKKAGMLSGMQRGQIQSYLRVIGLAVAILFVVYLWMKA